MKTQGRCGTTDAMPAGNMLTIVVLLSGAHRLEWLAQALDSIPIESSPISAVHIMHQGGAWNWAPDLRRRYESHPKVRVFEFDQRLGFVGSFNRCMNTVESKWALLLPDDDYLMPQAFEQMLDLSAAALASDAGFVSFGWYYSRRNSYLPDHMRRYDAAHLQRYAPKFCTTLIQVAHFRNVGGFDERFGGFCDTVLFARLANEFNAWRSPTPVGVYRLHEQQGSSNAGTVYEPYLEATLQALRRYSRDDNELQRLASKIRIFMAGNPSALGRAFDWLNVGLRGRDVPEPAVPRRPMPLMAHVG